MDLKSVGDLIATICIHYPGLKKNCETSDGKLNKNFAEEWLRQIGYLDYDEALRRFDQYLKLPEGNKYAPDVRWFLGMKHNEGQKEETTYTKTANKWHLVFSRADKEQKHGRLFDEEDREYVHDPLYEDGYHYDAYWNICTADGRVIYRRI